MAKVTMEKLCIDWCAEQDPPWPCEKVTWFSHGRHHDFLGCVDLLAIGEPDTWDARTILIQTTSASNHSARRKKILESKDVLAPWIYAMSASVEVWSWRQKGKDWVLRREAVL